MSHIYVKYQDDPNWVSQQENELPRSLFEIIPTPDLPEDDDENEYEHPLDVDGLKYVTSLDADGSWYHFFRVPGATTTIGESFAITRWLEKLLDSMDAEDLSNLIDDPIFQAGIEDAQSLFDDDPGFIGFDE